MPVCSGLEATHERDENDGVSTVAVMVDPDVLQQLRILTERLERLRIQCRAITSYRKGKWIPIAAPTVEESDSVGMLLASMRLSIAELEIKIANEIPTVSRSRSKTYRFRGSKKMERGDGERIRSDSRHMSRSSLYRKWCVDEAHNKYGFPGGTGIYTKRQVIGALTNCVGGHLVKR